MPIMDDISGLENANCFGVYLTTCIQNARRNFLEARCIRPRELCYAARRSSANALLNNSRMLEVFFGHDHERKSCQIDHSVAKDELEYKPAIFHDKRRKYKRWTWPLASRLRSD